MSSADVTYDVVRQIPRGRVTTYGAIAKLLGLPNARMVGHAMRSVDEFGRPVPAQRVVTALCVGVLWTIFSLAPSPTRKNRIRRLFWQQAFLQLHIGP
jgi:hypothetical protein